MKPQLALRNLVTCNGETQCNEFWARAVAYVHAHATTPVQSSGSNIVITAPPETRDDVSLTLSRIPDKTGSTESIFLDMQCKSQTSKRRRLCRPAGR